MLPSSRRHVQSREHPGARAGTEKATDIVFGIRPGGAPGRSQVTEYSQGRFMGGVSRVQVTGCQETSATSGGVTLSCSKLAVPVLIRSGTSQSPLPNPPFSDM